MRPDPHDRTWSDLFEYAVPERLVTVVVDDDVLADTADEDAWALTTVLAGQLDHPMVRAFRYADDGPPSDALRVSPWGEGSFAPGWIVATAAPDVELYSHSLTWSLDEDSATSGAIIGNIVEYLSSDTKTAVYRNLPPAKARDRRARDAVAAGAAREVHADLFVTERPFLLARARDLIMGCAIVSPTDAAAVLGLLLRSRRQYQVWRAPGAAVRFNKGLWFWVGAREMLPAGWRWFSACVQHSTDSGDDELMLSAQFALQRVTRALQARDALWQAISSMQSSDVAEDALIALDSVLLFLMGAVDATARVAHAAAGLPEGKLFNAGWQRSRWFADLVKAEPMFAGLMAPATAHADMMLVLSRLRNTVHGAGLLSVAVSKFGRRHDETLVRMPERDAVSLLEAMDRRSDREDWGVRSAAPGQVHLEPGPLVEKLFPMVADFLNEVMTRTPVEKLVTRPLDPASQRPPERAGDPFQQRFRDSIRWQLGIA